MNARASTLPPPRNVAWEVVLNNSDPAASPAWASTPFLAACDAERRASAEFTDGDALLDDVTVTRRPEWDRYGAKGPDAAALLDAGWMIECWYCGHDIDGASGGCEKCAQERGDDVVMPPVTRDEAAWCSEACRDAYVAGRAAAKARRENASAKALARWPWITVTDVYNVLVEGVDAGNVHFTFDGGRRGSWRDCDDEPMVAPVNEEAWHACVAKHAGEGR